MPWKGHGIRIKKGKGVTEAIESVGDSVEFGSIV